MLKIKRRNKVTYKLNCKLDKHSLRNAGIGLVGSLILDPLVGGADTAVRILFTIVYHVACIKDAEEDYQDYIK